MAEAVENNATEATSDLAHPPMEMSRKRSKVDKGEGLWLMSFSDMSLILMSFFILQLAFSTPDKRKYENVAEALDKQQDKPQQENLAAIERKLKTAIKAKKLDKFTEVTSDIHGLSVEFKDNALFATGSADVNAQAATTLEGVLDVIANTPGRYRLVIEGHTDDAPITSGKFRSNWDLASLRGIALVQSFKARGVKDARMSVSSYAQTRPKVPYSGLKGEALKKARAANRRVVIRIE